MLCESQREVPSCVLACVGEDEGNRGSKWKCEEQRNCIQSPGRQSLADQKGWTFERQRLRCRICE